MTVLATELLNGQGLGNQLFCYVTTRCLALDKGYDFCILNREILANNIHSNKGMYFMDLECGVELTKEFFDKVYHEKEDRIYVGNSIHDITKGCYITGKDTHLTELKESTLLYGNMQDEAYFIKYREQIKQWMRVKPEFEHYEYSADNICVINIRGGEYFGSPELFLRRKYWLDAMKLMRKKRADMQFVVVTDDLEAAAKILPEVPAYHGDLATDYTRIKNAHYLILSNSSFAYFPAITSDTLQFAIAPKYWARHNVSDGYWASEQNIYQNFMYLDRKGRLFTAEECRRELEEYKKKSKRYRQIGIKLNRWQKIKACVRIKYLLYKDWAGRIIRSLLRRIKRLTHEGNAG